MKKLMFLAVLGAVCSIQAADIFVDYGKGKSGNAGSRDNPLPDFASAMRIVKPGDTVFILPSPVPVMDNLLVRDICGTAEKPITIDGMNNIFTGAAPLDMKQWREVRTGLFRRRCKMQYSRLARYFMVWNGRMQRMGRIHKAPGHRNYNLKSPEALQPGEWTAVPAEQKEPKKVKWWDFYLRLPEGVRSPADIGAAEPSEKLYSGVQIEGRCRYVEFRNIIVKNFLNDGFNIHGDAKKIRFENIAAVDCGDDGLSAHDSGEIYVKNYAAIGNSTAICHIGEAVCYHENIYAEQNAGSDIYLLKDTVNTVNNLFLRGDSVKGLLVTNKKGAINMNNCVAVNRNPKAQFRIKPAAGVKCSLSGLEVSNYSAVTLPAGVKVQKNREDSEEKIEKFRKSLFALFGGNLEKALQ